MKAAIIVLVVVSGVAYAGPSDKAYTGSTPAAPIVRTFLGISLTDSIDFIRWNLTISTDQYSLNCNYGIGKPNTNGFANGGVKVSLTGTWIKEKNIYRLKNTDKLLALAELNPDLLYLLDSKNNLLVGNGGWSYVLNSLTPAISDQLNLSPVKPTVKDSVAFQGRTPCGVPGVANEPCYKLKWLIILYGNSKTNEPGKYKALGTPWRQEGGRSGAWKIVTGKDNRTIYHLLDEKGNVFIYLLKLDDNVLFFTDSNGKLLVGDLDFGYALNRKW